MMTHCSQSDPALRQRAIVGAGSPPGAESLVQARGQMEAVVANAHQCGESHVTPLSNPGNWVDLRGRSAPFAMAICYVRCFFFSAAGNSTLLRISR